jgi:PAS domain S-box-containing protein/putative nucleotidyltransferase with HDIG domain
MIESISRAVMLQDDNHLKASILDRICDMVFVYDFWGRICYVNDIVCRLLGYNRNKLMKLNFTDLFLKNCSEADKTSSDGIAFKGDTTFESSLICSDKSNIPVEIHTCMVKLNENKYLLSTARKISDRIHTKIRMESEVELNENIKQIIDTITAITEMRDPYTAGHQKGVGSLVYAIAKELKLPESMVKGVYVSAILHDIGKIYVPNEILTKPGRITQDEMNIIKTHSQIGSDILKNIRFPWPVAQIVLQHHERVDGSGYPFGISSESILFEAKILSVADVVEAMSFHRPYRPALGIDNALAEISDNKGSLYDPDVVDSCVRLFTTLDYKFDESLPEFNNVFK